MQIYLVEALAQGNGNVLRGVVVVDEEVAGASENRTHELKGALCAQVILKQFLLFKVY